jgi:hypothetical protein
LAPGSEIRLSGTAPIRFLPWSALAHDSVQAGMR